MYDSIFITIKESIGHLIGYIMIIYYITYIFVRTLNFITNFLPES